MCFIANSSCLQHRDDYLLQPAQGYSSPYAATHDPSIGNWPSELY